ncbi:MAG: MBOAT family O-acyltransferase [Planctomycetota bacterium]
MLFHSLSYAALLLSAVLICCIVGGTHRWLVLLAASVAFYVAWRPEYFLLLLLTASSCHFGARLLQCVQRIVLRRLILAVVVASNLLVLMLYKYYGLFAQSANGLFGVELPIDLGLLLPVGISFYTFQAIGYVADVYQRRIESESSWLRSVLFVSFFPQLVAGPIERAGNLIPALRAPIWFRWRNVRLGCWLVLWGLFKKVVIADRLSLLVDFAYQTPDEQGGGLLLLASYAFAFQIYCDFSGYTDMAIGSAKIFGIDLMANFRFPYAARSIREFWSRWHISLTTWFRDYLYIPLGGNRVTTQRWVFNILVVFAISGLWHGAKWTFVIWGLIHGTLLLVETAVISIARKSNDESQNLSALGEPTLVAWKYQAWCAAWNGVRILITFHIVLLAWVFFRADKLGDAMKVIQIVASELSSNAFGFFDIVLPSVFSRFEMAVAILGLCWMCLIEIPLRGNVSRVVGIRPREIGKGIIIATGLLVLNFGVFSNPTQFVYFQF